MIAREVLDAAARIIKPGITTDEINAVVHEATASKDMSKVILSKSRLQEFTQKRSLPAPIYETTREGPPHEPIFKALVIVNGVKYECPSTFRNRKSAEQAAAYVALQELVKEANDAENTPSPVLESGLCKNLLQEYAQKVCLPVPSYSCTKTGERPEVKFSCTVEIAGFCYIGGPAKSKKEAEIKAARTALLALQAQYSVPLHSNVAGSTSGANSDAVLGVKRERPPGELCGQKAFKKRKKQSKAKFGKKWKRERVAQQSTITGAAASGADSKDIQENEFAGVAVQKAECQDFEQIAEHEIKLLDDQVIDSQAFRKHDQIGNTSEENLDCRIQAVDKTSENDILNANKEGTKGLDEFIENPDLQGRNDNHKETVSVELESLANCQHGGSDFSEISEKSSQNIVTDTEVGEFDRSKQEDQHESLHTGKEELFHVSHETDETIY